MVATHGPVLRGGALTIEIGNFWHVNQVVDDYKATSDWYRRVFGAVDIFVDDWAEAEQRWATMLTIGDLAIDVMEPTAEGAELALGKFRTRFGQHFSAAAYWVDGDPAEVFDALTAAGVRCFGGTGSSREEMATNRMRPVFTHPKDTAGQLEFMPFIESKPGPLGFPGKWEDPRFLEGWSTEPWRTHPLGIHGWRLGVVVSDLDRAASIYGALGAVVTADETAGSVRRLRIKVGASTTVELIKPLSADSVAGQDLAANGEILHSCVFECADLAAVESHLEAHDVVIAERFDGRLITDPKTCHGGVFEFVTTGSD